MNKNDLVNRTRQIAGFTAADATKAVDAVFQAIQEAVSDGDEVRIINFGTFYVQAREASEGRNPRTGDVINIPASRQPKFKAGKAFKEACNSAKTKSAKKKAA